MSAAPLLAELGSGVLTLTIDRPEARHALDRAVLLALLEQLEDAARSGEVRVVVVRSSGTGPFCAGADVRELVGLDEHAAADHLALGRRVLDTLAGAPFPVIAQVQGAAVGGGFELVLACTIVVASEEASFALPETRLGLIPGYGGTQRLAPTVGAAVATYLGLTGAPLCAAAAYQHGLLALPPVAAADLGATTSTVVDAVLAGGRDAVQAVLSLRDVPRGDHPGLRREAELAARAVASAEGQRRIGQFLERRSGGPR